MSIRLSTTSPRERLDTLIDRATDEQCQRLIAMLEGLNPDQANELFSAIISMRDVAAGAAFFAGFYAATSPGAWLLGVDGQKDGLTNFILGVIVGVLIVGVVWAIVMAGANLR